MENIYVLHYVLYYVIMTSLVMVSQMSQLSEIEVITLLETKNLPKWGRMIQDQSNMGTI